MTTTFLISAAAVCLAAGVFMLWRALNALPSESDIVPKEEHDRKQRDLDLAMDAQESARRDLDLLRRELETARESLSLKEKESGKISGELAASNVKARELEIRAAEASEKIKALEAHAGELRQKEAAYQKQITGLEGKVLSAEQLAQQLLDLQESNKALKTENGQLQEKYRKEIENLKAIETERAALEASLQASGSASVQGSEEVKKVNQQLAEQNTLIQTELVKARARAQGLEKICSDYQVQLEELLRSKA